MEELTEGYLLLADISGFTSFLAQSELDHAHGILHDLLDIVTEHLEPTLSKIVVEGDAVFCHAPAEHVPKGETLLHIIDATYLAFRDRLVAIEQRTTCTCRACKCVPNLDLKFMVHFGSYIGSTATGSFNLLGSDVNLVHRLLKNSVSEETGWHAYTLLTEAAYRQIGVALEHLHEGTEEYEHLGETQTVSFDMHPRYEALAGARRVFLEPEDGDTTFSVISDAPLSILWEWVNDPSRREQWQDAVVTATERPRGRTGPGARNHCAHGKTAVLETIVDWKPFRYLTVEGVQGKMTVLYTMSFEPVPEGTQLTCTFKAKAPGPGFLVRTMCRRHVNKKFLPKYEQMARLAAEDARRWVAEQPASVPEAAPA